MPYYINARDGGDTSCLRLITTNMLAGTASPLAHMRVRSGFHAKHAGADGGTFGPIGGFCTSSATH